MLIPSLHVLESMSSWTNHETNNTQNKLQLNHSKTNHKSCCVTQCNTLKFPTLYTNQNRKGTDEIQVLHKKYKI